MEPLAGPATKVGGYPKLVRIDVPSATSTRMSARSRWMPPMATISSSDTSRVSTQPGQSDTMKPRPVAARIMSASRSPAGVSGMPPLRATRTASPARRTSVSRPAFAPVEANR